MHQGKVKTFYPPERPARAFADASLMRRHYYAKDESFTFPDFYERKMDENLGLQLCFVDFVKTDEIDREAYIVFGDPDEMMVAESAFVAASNGKWLPNRYMSHEMGHHRTQNLLGPTTRNFESSVIKSINMVDTRNRMASDFFEHDAEAWAGAWQVPIHQLDGKISAYELAKRYHSEPDLIEWCRKALRQPAIRERTIALINSGEFSNTPPNPSDGRNYWQDH